MRETTKEDVSDMGMNVFNLKVLRASMFLGCWISVLCAVLMLDGFAYLKCEFIVW